MAKQIGIILGVVFLAIGVLGFFPNPIVSENGFFATNMGHNLVHIITAIIFIWVAAAASKNTPLTLKIFGVVYLVVALLGFWVGTGNLLGFIYVNPADNWLHVVLGVVIFLLGFVPSAEEGGETAAAAAGGTGAAAAGAMGASDDGNAPAGPSTSGDVAAGGAPEMNGTTDTMSQSNETGNSDESDESDEETKQV